MEQVNRTAEIFQDKLRSKERTQQNQEYLERLYDQLNAWKSRTDKQLAKIIEEKIEEIKAMYEQYRQEVGDKYVQLIQQRQNNNSLPEVKGTTLSRKNFSVFLFGETYRV